MGCEDLLALLPEAISLVNRAFLFDNSEQCRQLVAEFEGGKLIAVALRRQSGLMRCESDE